jgi:hypothetical protein
MNAVGSLRVKSGRRGKGGLREQPPHVIWRLLEPRIYDLPYLADEDLELRPFGDLRKPSEAILAAVFASSNLSGSVRRRSL